MKEYRYPSPEELERIFGDLTEEEQIELLEELEQEDKE